MRWTAAFRFWSSLLRCNNHFFCRYEGVREERATSKGLYTAVHMIRSIRTCLSVAGVWTCALVRWALVGDIPAVIRSNTSHARAFLILGKYNSMIDINSIPLDKQRFLVKNWRTWRDWSVDIGDCLIVWSIDWSINEEMNTLSKWQLLFVMQLLAVIGGCMLRGLDGAWLFHM